MFNVNGPPENPDNLFSLDCKAENSKVHILPVPFDATSSYRRVAAEAPKAILRASQQLDLFDPLLGEPWKHGIWMYPFSKDLFKMNVYARHLVDNIRFYRGRNNIDVVQKDLNELYSVCVKLHNIVFSTTSNSLHSKRIPGILGGDHSVSFGAIDAASSFYNDLVVVQIDAHSDLRNAYEGFFHSHASVMYNVLKYTKVAGLVQFGIRDTCPEEAQFLTTSNKTIYTFYDQLYDIDNIELTYIDNRLVTCVGGMAANLLYNKPVWITCDIDGLDSSLCPNTGTPVPGGLSWKQFCRLLNAISGLSNIVGFDLVEVGHEEWDANVGSRALYQLAGNALWHNNGQP